jgi:hypothetical protein
MFRFAVCALALSLAGCGDDANTSGPVLKSGPWYGYFVDFNDQLRGNFHGDVDINGNIHLHVEGTLADFNTRFNFDTNAAVLYEGSNFSVSGNEGNLPVSGYGRERVFDTMFVVAIPIDSLNEHALTVGLDRWEFQMQGGASLNSASGAWSVRSLQSGVINTGMFIAAPGDLFPLDAMDDGALDAPVDAPVDAGTD